MKCCLLGLFMVIFTRHNQMISELDAPCVNTWFLAAVGGGGGGGGGGVQTLNRIASDRMGQFWRVSTNVDSRGSRSVMSLIACDVNLLLQYATLWQVA